MSTESCNSRFMADAGMLQRYLELTRKCMERVQSMTSVPSGSTSPKFNLEQCEYLVGKLRLAVESANFFLLLFNRGNIWFTSAEALANCLENFKLLYTLSGEVESFTRECCREEWLHAALTLTDVSEHVSSMGFDLQLWSKFLSFESQQSLTLREVDSIFTSEVETVKAKASLDKKILSASLDAVLRSTERSSSKHTLAAFVLDRLGSNLKPTDELAGSPQASFSEEVLRNLKNQKKRHLLGKGASAHVYSLTWSGAEFAVKTYFGEENKDFNKEVSVLRNLFHPNIVSVWCYAQEKRKCSIIMEKMDEDLHSFMQARCEENRAPFGILEGVDIMLQIGRGMHYLHGLRIAHRDLKSSNILVRTVQATELEVEYVMVKIADFSMSKTDLKSMTYTPQTFNMGTARWMAPELIKFSGAENTTECEAPEKKFPLKCDIYSFAIVCYEILTGEHPFEDIASQREVRRLVLDGTRPLLPAGCPEKLKHLIERCWSPNAETRPTFGEICAELRHLKYLLTSSDGCLLASSSFTSFRRDFQLSHPTEVDQGEARNPLQSHHLDNEKTAKIQQGHKNVLPLGLPTVSAVSGATAADASVSDYSNVDYLEQSISSIDVVQKLSKDLKVQFNVRQCEYLADKLTETGCILRAKFDSLIAISDSADIRRKALLQLHFAVKRGERLVRGCCCKDESWLEAAVTQSHVKEDIKDILLDLRWWTSMLSIAIASVTWMTNGQTIFLGLLKSAEEDYGKLLSKLHEPNNDLDRTTNEDEYMLLSKVREVETSFANGWRTAEQKHEYLLAVQVRSRLENSEVETLDDLNEHDDAKLIGMGTYSAVLDVRWMGRRCALKVSTRVGNGEATRLRRFQHPYIVKFFRYWEAPYGQELNGTPNGSPQGTTGSDSGQAYGGSLQSHILMELLPMDLSQRLIKLRSMANFTVGSKQKPERSRGALLPEDVALDVMLQLVKAMWHLNNNEVAHRDLKPNNVLVRPVSDDEVPELNYQGYLRAKLADFGLAKTRALSSAFSTQPKYCGTKLYGAPEVFNKDIFISEKKYPRQADVWSFGIMCCEVLTGKPPFSGVVDGKIDLRTLHDKIVKGLRPKLPENCPDYLKFIIESCWQLRPEDRPTFEDLWRLIRIAQVRSLGIIQMDHDLFWYKSRTGVKSLRSAKKILVSASSGSLVYSDAALERGSRIQKLWSMWWFMINWMCHNLARIAARVAARVAAQERSSRPLPRRKRGFSRACEVLGTRYSSKCNPLGYLVNQMGPPNVDISESKLDVIFFEGNVGRKKDLSCKDTWVQRNNPDVWWPRDWLPKDLGDDIRVLLLEYSISDDGVEGVLDQLERLLVFSERWNRKHTWERPIVLVGHSLGCVVIEHLVVALDKRAKSIHTLKDELEIGLAKVAEAFLTSLAGCIFYAPPWTGLVPSEDLLTYVFGGLSYSRELFSDLCLDSPKLKLLSEEFVRVKRKHMKLTAVVEGFHTRGRLVVPPTSMEGFEGTVVELMDSNHIDVCKPTHKDHLAYTHLLNFIGDSLQNPKGVVVNQVWPLENSVACERTKLNIIFFEGNVGEREFTSIKDMWVQRGNNGVCWPQDWLPLDLGTNIRILLLKYCISDYMGLEGVVSALQEKLIFSDAWSQNQEWENPVVLVGHSLGCAVIQHLVVRLHHDSMKMEANTSKAFIKNLRGCFFYAPPLNGFVPSESVLKVVFGGLKFSTDLFWPFLEGSPKLRMLLEDFKLIVTRRQISIEILSEGKKTGEEMVVVAPRELTDYVLSDSNHNEVCQPVSKDHRSYKEFLDFMSNTLQKQGSSNLNSSHQAKSFKNSELDVDPREQKDPSHMSKENKELSDMLKQKINEVDNVVEMQQADDMRFISSEFEVLVIGNHNEEDDTLVFHFLDGQSMAKVTGVGLDYAKVILRNGLEIEVQEVSESEWESAWSHSKSMENVLHNTMKVKVPMQNDIEPTRALDQEDHCNVTRPLLWDVARYFTMQKLLATLSNGDAGQSSKDGPAAGSGSGKSKDTNSTIAVFFNAFKSWFSMQFIKRGGRKDDDDDEDKDRGRTSQGKVDFNGSDAKVKVTVKLMPAGYSFEKGYPEDFGVQIDEKSKYLVIKSELEFEFFKNEGGKKISLSLADIRFGIYEHPSGDNNEQLEGDRYGAFHDKFSVSFSAENPASIDINSDVKSQGCNPGKIFHTEGYAKLKGKGNEFAGSISIGGGFAGASMNGGVIAKRSSTVENTHTTSITSEYSSTFSAGGFDVQPVIQEGGIEFKFLAPPLFIEDPARLWDSREYRNEKRRLPHFKAQTVQFSGSWEVRSDEKLEKYHLKVLRCFGEFMRIASTSSKILPSFLSSSKHVYKKLLYKQVYEKALFLNHEMTHWKNYTLSEKVVDHLTTPSKDPCPLVGIDPRNNSP